MSRNFTEVPPKDVLTPQQQFAYRYILSVEGCDVATNLKWVMASNSVCLMPRPRYETWFMEGALIAGHHYVEVRDDFSDLEEKIDELEADPLRAREIVANANRHVAMFRNGRMERFAARPAEIFRGDRPAFALGLQRGLFRNDPGRSPDPRNGLSVITA